jgi:homoserine dehydrogenase
MTDLRLCLLGFGSVARELCRLLNAQERVLEALGLRILITGVGTRHGSLLAPDGMTPAAVLGSVGDGASPPQAAQPALHLLAASHADVLVELTAMERDFAPASTGHIEDAFALGMDVVTANKGPIACNWPRIVEQARTHRRRIRCESTVMDGLPVFSLLEFALPHCRLLGFDAVFNSTTNAIIEAIGTGGLFEDALAQAQDKGIAEADPDHDIDGWDAACKGAALANVAMDAAITPADIERQSLRDVAPELILKARAAGLRLRLVTQVWRDPATGQRPGRVRGRVQARELPIDHPLAPIGGESLGVVLHTDLMGDMLVAELGGMVPQTAYGVYADLLHLWRSR